MAEIKWIKITTSMFDDEKIKLIEGMPDKDVLLTIWIKLLIQAGKTNAGGYIFLTENIPYTDEMLSTIFNRPLNTIRLALKLFQQYGMIRFSEKGILIIDNWEKHQNIEAMEKIRIQAKVRKQRQREREKNLLPDVTQMSRESHATDIDQDIDLDKELNIYIDFLDFWALYPKKVGKDPAKKKWDKLKVNDKLFALIKKALLEQCKSTNWTKDNGQYIPNPATWLNQKRWEDEINNGTGGTDIKNSDQYSQYDRVIT